MPNEPITVNAIWEPLPVDIEGNSLRVGGKVIGGVFRECAEGDYEVALMLESVGKSAYLYEARQILVGAFRSWMEEVTGQTVHVFAKPKRGELRILDQNEVDG